MRKFIILLASIGIFSLSRAQALPSNKQLTIGVTQEFANMNLLVNSLQATSYIYYMVNHPLIAIDANWQWKCWLCTQVPTLENGGAKKVKEGDKEKLLVQWEIRKEAKWGDGTPVTGNDFKLGWEVGNDPAVSTPEKDLYQRIEEVTVDAKDPKKFTIKYREARYDYFQLGTFVLLPAHLEKEVYEKTKGQNGAYEKQTKYNTDPTNPGLYNGPYLIKEIKLGSHVVIERNPQFGPNKPAIDKIIVKLIPNTQTLEANLLSGTIDLVSELGFTFDQALEFEKRLKKEADLAKKFQLQFEDGMVYEHIDLNLRNPVLADTSVRQALLYAVDRQKLVDALFEGRQKVALTFMHPKDPYFTTEVPKYNYDPAQAEKLLDAAGWVKGADGMRAKNGTKLEFTLMTTAQNKVRELVQVFLQQEWKKLGIKIDIQNEPARVFFGETVRKARYTAMAMYAWVSSPDNPPRSTLSSTEIPTAENGYSGQNSGGWRSKVADDIFDKIYTEFDFNKRKQLMVELQKEYATEVPVVPLFMRADIAVIPSNLQGFKMTGHQFLSTLSVDQWTLGNAPSH